MRYVKFIFAILLIVNSIVGYDWSDSDYNFILRSDLEDSLEYLDDLQPVHYRKTRDVSPTPSVKESNETSSTTPMPDRCRPNNRPPPPPPPIMGHNRYQRTCCGNKDDLMIHAEALKEIKRNCFAEVRKSRMMMPAEVEPFDVFKCDVVNKMKEEMVCVTECVAKKKNLLEENGNIEATSVMAFVKAELAKEEWQKKIIDGIMEKCLKNMSTNGTTTRSEKTTEYSMAKDESIPQIQCNPSMMNFSHCMWREMQIACPADQFKDTRSCQRMRDRLMNKEYPDNDRRTRTTRSPNNNKKSDKKDES